MQKNIAKQINKCKNITKYLLQRICLSLISHKLLKYDEHPYLDISVKQKCYIKINVSKL